VLSTGKDRGLATYFKKVVEDGLAKSDEGKPGWFRRVGGTLVPVLFFGMISGTLVLHVLSPARSARLGMLDEDHQRISGDVDHLRLKAERLKAELHSFQDGAEGWREVARRDLGMIAPGEVVFRFPTEKP
jgi:hypothetical protein